jgi:hypothetical protein
MHSLSWIEADNLGPSDGAQQEKQPDITHDLATIKPTTKGRLSWRSFSIKTSVSANRRAPLERMRVPRVIHQLPVSWPPSSGSKIFQGSRPQM